MFAFLFTTTGAWASLILDFYYAAGRAKEALPDLRIPKKTWLALFPLLVAVGYVHGCHTLTRPAHLYLLALIPARLVAFVLVVASAKAVANAARLGREELKRRMKTRSVILKVLVAVLLLVLVLKAPVAIPMVDRAVSYSRAVYMRSSFTEMAVGNASLFPEVDPARLRVTTSGIARSIAEMKKTSAASMVTSVHLGIYNGELCWVATVSEPPVFGSSSWGPATG